MGKAVGYIIALVVVVGIIYLVATHGKRTVTNTVGNTVETSSYRYTTYAAMKELALKFRYRTQSR